GPLACARGAVSPVAVAIVAAVACFIHASALSGFVVAKPRPHLITGAVRHVAFALLPTARTAVAFVPSLCHLWYLRDNEMIQSIGSNPRATAGGPERLVWAWRVRKASSGCVPRAYGECSHARRASPRPCWCNEHVGRG